MPSIILPGGPITEGNRTAELAVDHPGWAYPRVCVTTNFPRMCSLQLIILQAVLLAHEPANLPQAWFFRQLD